MSYTKLTRDQIAERVAQDIPDGAYVNLGIGLPTKISNYLPTIKMFFYIQKMAFWLLVLLRLKAKKTLN
jgi:Acyl CoA:acetate/3-ketoacid CoA transferase, beta subunit